MANLFEKIRKGNEFRRELRAWNKAVEDKDNEAVRGLSVAWYRAQLDASDDRCHCGCDDC